MLPAVFTKTSGILNIAHRGASAEFPENTMPAFRAAVARGADMIELDVQWTKDRVPVIFHDHKINHRTDGTGLIRDFCFKDLQKLDAGVWFGREFTGLHIPSLEEVLQFAEGFTSLNIEIKAGPVADERQQGIEQCLQLVENYNMVRHVLFSSFDIRVLRTLKCLASDIPAALLYSQKQGGAQAVLQLMDRNRIDAFHCNVHQLSQRRLRALKERQLPVSVYTVNNLKRMKKFITMGVDGIFTDKPSLLRDAITMFRKQNRP